MKQNEGTQLQWLQGLLYIQLAGCVLTALTILSGLIQISFGGWIATLQRAVSIGTALCLLLLPGRYRISGGAKALVLVCNLLPVGLHAALRLDVNTYLTVSMVLGRISGILALVALYLEYTAHAAQAPDLSRPWHILLVCGLGVSLVSTAALQLFQKSISNLVQNGETWVITLYNSVAHTLNLIINILYLVLLHRTIDSIRKETEADGTERGSF